MFGRFQGPLRQLSLVASGLTLLVGGICSGIQADVTGRDAVAGRDAVRRKLAIAVSDGSLTRMEQYSILLMAREVLPQAEVLGLQVTMDRLASREESTPATNQEAFFTHESRPEKVIGEPTPAKRPIPQDSEVDKPVPVEPVPLEEELSPGEPSSPLLAQLEVAPEIGDTADAAAYDEPVSPPLPESSQDSLPDGSLDTLGAEMNAAESSMHEEGEFVSGNPFVLEEDEIFTPGRVPFQATRLGCFVNDSDIRFSALVTGFKGPLDLDNRNGNFGTAFAVNGGFPLFRGYGIGVQAGTGAVLSNFHGTQFSGDTIRRQQFTTLGLFQRVGFTDERLKYGFAFDWLHDVYYASMTLSQWRVKLGYELSPCSEIGLLAMIPNDGTDARLNTAPPQFDRMAPVSQGHLYHRRSWENGITTTTRLGLVEEPGSFAIAADALIPFNDRMSLVGTFNYVLPSASGAGGQDEEMWNIGLGIELTTRPCGARDRNQRFSPLFRLADNAIFNIRRH